MTRRSIARAIPALLATTYALLPAARGAASVAEDWAVTLTKGTSQLYGAMIDVSPTDDIYVTGSDPLADTIITSRLFPSGGQLWQVEFDNPGTRERGAWLDVDPFGDVVVAGYHVSGGSLLPSGFVTLKYDPSGNLLWWDSTPYTRGLVTRVATDASGNVIVLGRAWFGTDDIVTVKFSPNGTKLWTQVAGVSATSVDSANDLKVDAAGNIYVTGGTIGAMLTIAYDPNGNVLWSYQSSSVGAGTALALGPGGEVYVAGVGASAVRLLKFDAAGNLVWSNTYSGIAGNRLAVDSKGNVIVTGYTGTGGYTDWITHKIDANGTLLWTAIYNKHQFNDEFPYGLTIGPDDEIYVTGQGGPGPTSGMLSYLKTATVRYSKDGVEEWFAANDLSLRGLGVARLSDNSIAVVGQSTFTVFHYTQAGVFTSVGGALAGTAGLPRLEGSGSPTGGSPIALELSNARPSAPAWLIAGPTQANLPFMGGLLVPSPLVVLGGFTTLPSGTIQLPFVWPALPPGFVGVFQFWIADPAAPQGFAASNGLIAISG